jgi:sec-independent protein translocase protein TatA
MFGNLFSGWHLVIIVALVLLLFGATKLPALAKGLGESIRILRKESRPPAGAESGTGAEAGADGAADAGAADSPAAPAPPAGAADDPAADPPQRD